MLGAKYCNDILSCLTPPPLPSPPPPPPPLLPATTTTYISFCGQMSTCQVSTVLYITLVSRRGSAAWPMAPYNGLNLKHDVPVNVHRCPRFRLCYSTRTKHSINQCSATVSPTAYRRILLVNVTRLCLSSACTLFPQESACQAFMSKMILVASRVAHHTW